MGGVLGSVGQKVVARQAGQVTRQFAEALERAIKGEPDPAASAPAANGAAPSAAAPAPASSASASASASTASTASASSGGAASPVRLVVAFVVGSLVGWFVHRQKG
jgi:hypothetical protein